MAGKVFTFTSGNGSFRYVAVKELGKGSFGEVFEASEQVNSKPTGRSVAIKQSFYHGNGISSEYLRELREKMDNNHVRIKRITNPHVTSYHHVKMEESVGLELSLTVVIAMEYCNLGNLENFTKTHKLSNGEIKDIIKQVLSGLVAIHEQGIIHTDLKTANIVLASDTHFAYGRVVKITDLDDHVGLASTVTRVNEVTNKRGTIIFMSPEMLTGGHNGYQIGRRTDVWSMGCVIVELYRKGKDFLFVKKMTGINTPVEMLNAHRAREEAICSFITTGGKPEIPEDIPDLSRTMVQKCFEIDPKKRISASELLQSGWFEEPTVVQINQAPGTSKMEFTLSNGERIPPPDDELKWDVRMACAARVLVHHTNTTRFPYQHPSFYKAEVDLVRKVIEPRQPLDPKFHEWMAKLLDTKGPLAHSLNPITRLIHMIVQPTGPRMSALLTTFLPTIGPSFPAIAEWMNRYTTDYEYVCKGHASWPDIKKLIDKKEPVIAQVRLYDLPMGDMVKTIAEMVGIGEHCPPTFPYICAKILRGYEGSKANGEPATVIYTNPDGKTGMMEFEEFKKEADWTPSHPLLKEVFDLAGYEPRQIIYRIQKVAGMEEIGSTDNSYKQVANVPAMNFLTPVPPRNLSSHSEESRGEMVKSVSTGTTVRPTAPPNHDVIVHSVKYGDTLSAIGVKYGVPYPKIVKDNNIIDMNKVPVGTELKIIRSNGSEKGNALSAQTLTKDAAAKPVEAVDPAVTIHTIQYGDTLSAIGVKYGVPYMKIARDNNIANPNSVPVGKQLKIIRNNGLEKAETQTGCIEFENYEYIVKYGDTLSELGVRFHVPYKTIAQDNGISDPNKIYVGMKLKIRRVEKTDLG
ncbi:uncharacterized protein LOC129584154 isoform X2 [Paramacrobiotus metropolitanus]|uniref:uncharacterized protein LOC129584154 isoform X2 n=1 Tax=Paramacrobiotus metropolitanus TaxID=2943436 RepID=UPI00244627A1|nr:uncharacterized protein LOC129584154 isoform X2 [Paramacrobiotus metropolitanus]